MWHYENSTGGMYLSDEWIGKKENEKEKEKEKVQEKDEEKAKS